VTERQKLTLNPKYTKRIVILQKGDYRGRQQFFILHKKNRWSRLSMDDIPKDSRVRRTLDLAEEVAFDLIKNYEKVFMS
jgi:hypothetical protein